MLKKRTCVGMTKRECVCACVLCMSVCWLNDRINQHFPANNISFLKGLPKIISEVIPYTDDQINVTTDWNLNCTNQHHRKHKKYFCGLNILTEQPSDCTNGNTCTFSRASGQLGVLFNCCWLVLMVLWTRTSSFSDYSEHWVSFSEQTRWIVLPEFELCNLCAVNVFH